MTIRTLAKHVALWIYGFSVMTVMTVMTQTVMTVMTVFNARFRSFSAMRDIRLIRVPAVIANTENITLPVKCHGHARCAASSAEFVNPALRLRLRWQVQPDEYAFDEFLDV